MSMAMDAVLKRLEARIDDLVTAYAEAKARETELAAKLEELEGKAASDADLGARIKALETQRDELAARLEKVLKLIDGALAEAD
jgi:predicted RNase H-like nuclease (RuvC/YqgF family)